jgi:methionyl aminopeptidase
MVCAFAPGTCCDGNLADMQDMRELHDGDIVNVDISCYLNGAHGDLNETFLVGQVDASSKKLVKVRTQPFCG